MEEKFVFWNIKKKRNRLWPKWGVPFSTGGWQGAADFLSTGCRLLLWLWWEGGVGCMFDSNVTLHFWHGWTTARSAKSSTIYHKREKPQVALHWNLLQLEQKKKAEKNSKEVGKNKRDIFDFWKKCSVCFAWKEEIWHSRSPHLWLWELHWELVWTEGWTHRTCNQCDYKHPADHRACLPLTQKRKSHQENMGSKAAHKAQTCGRLLSIGQPRQRHRNRRSVTASMYMTWTSLRVSVQHGSCSWASKPLLFSVLNLHSVVIR